MSRIAGPPRSVKPELAWRCRMVDRLTALITVAHARRYMPSLKELAREHGVCERTIRRDLAAIERHIPIRWRHREAA